MRKLLVLAAALLATAVAGVQATLAGEPSAASGKPRALTFAWPTSVDVEPGGSLLVVENGRGRVLRVRPATGRVTVVAARLANPFAAVRAPSGRIYVSGGRTLRRLDGAGKPVTVATADADIGPLAIAPNGDVYFSTSKRLFRLRAGGGAPVLVADGLNSAHGVAIAADGRVLVSDTSNHRVLRIEVRTGARSTLIRTTDPRGIDVAADGTIYVVEAGRKRVGRFSAKGVRRGFAGPVFGDPYDVVADPRGSVYVVDTGAAGRIVRVARDGTATPVPTG